MPDIIKDPIYGYLRVDPLPSAGELEAYYKNRYYTGRGIFRDFSVEPRKDELDFFAWRCGDIGDAVTRHFGRTAGVSLLDIGCGYGYSVKHFREMGLDAFGVEPSAEAAKYAGETGLRVIHGPIEGEGDYFGRRFDVVLLMDVLEHLREPWKLLARIRETMLAPGGLLVVDVPNDFNLFQMTADKLHRLNRWWVIPPEHINYFSVESVTRLISDCGFTVKDAVGSFPLEMFLLMGEVYVGNPEVGRECHAKRVAFERAMRTTGRTEQLLELYRGFARQGLGRQVVVYAVSAG